MLRGTIKSVINDEPHNITFQEMPEIGKQFGMNESGRGYWHTSIIKDIWWNKGKTLCTLLTEYSEYKLILDEN